MPATEEVLYDELRLAVEGQVAVEQYDPAIAARYRRIERNQHRIFLACQLKVLTLAVLALVLLI
jgi:hypothetical protein